MQTKISKEVLDSSNVADYVEENVRWVQYMDKLPEDATELKELIEKMPIGGLIITKEPSTK